MHEICEVSVCQYFVASSVGITRSLEFEAHSHHFGHFIPGHEIRTLSHIQKYFDFDLEQVENRAKEKSRCGKLNGGQREKENITKITNIMEVFCTS